jgi:hypothetical protein
MALHASRVHSVMVPAVHACGISSRVKRMAKRVVGPGPLSSWVEQLVRQAVNASSKRSAISGSATIGNRSSGLSAAVHIKPCKHN